MRLAVAGGTGTVGRHVVDAARARGHEVVVLSRSTGIDLMTGSGVDAALTGVDAVVDTSNTTAMSAKASVRAFRAMTGHLLAAEAAAGVGHHVALSIVGIDRGPKTCGYYQGKIAQEQAVTAGAVPWTIARATQFYEFARQMFERVKIGPVVLVPAMRCQPVAARDVAARLVTLAEGAPRGRVADLAGPRIERMADLARRYGRAAGLPGHVMELRMPGAAGRQMRGGGLLAEPGTELTAQDFTAWLIDETGSDGTKKASAPMKIAGISLVRAALPTPPEPSLSNAAELLAGLRTSGMPISLDIEGEPRQVPVRVDAAAFRALQEGVSIVLTRAPRVDATATVRYLPHAVEVEVAHGPARVSRQAAAQTRLTRSRSEVRALGGAIDAKETDDGALRVWATLPTPE